MKNVDLGELEMALRNGVTFREFARVVRPKLKKLIEGARALDALVAAEEDQESWHDGRWDEAFENAKKVSG